MQAKSTYIAFSLLLTCCLALSLASWKPVAASRQAWEGAGDVENLKKHATGVCYAYSQYVR